MHEKKGLPALSGEALAGTKDVLLAYVSPEVVTTRPHMAAVGVGIWATRTNVCFIAAI